MFYSRVQTHVCSTLNTPFKEASKVTSNAGVTPKKPFPLTNYNVSFVLYIIEKEEKNITFGEQRESGLGNAFSYKFSVAGHKWAHAHSPF